jgi:prepilin-type N-terminal cleavage/methylation domain-containing protein/prepilin-type processing-associated H-X9-DG protein
MKTTSLRRPSAFTLVELLVVIGIISILIALLIPVLSKMRESAKQVTCSGNLRALGQAMIMYASDNDGVLPATSQAGTANENPADWIWWQPDRAAKVADLTTLLRQSAIAKYISLTAATTNMLRCPSDNVEAHPGYAAGTSYPYSYVMNCFIAGSSSASSSGFAAKFTPYAGGPGSPAVSGTLCNSLHKVKNPSQKVLMYEQSEMTIDDGDGCPWYGASTPPSSSNPYWSGCAGGNELLAPNHDLSNFKVQSSDPLKEDTSNQGNYQPPQACAVPFLDVRGNVVFCDGHVDFVPRSFLHLPEHTIGNY